MTNCVNFNIALLGEKVLNLACRRHINELHVKHVSNAVGRPTKGNEDVLFKRFREDWNNLAEEGKISLENLAKFDFENCSSFVESQARKALIYLSRCLAEKSFDRGDYRELCELAVVFLGGQVL